jgi:hypothetical protein
VASLSDESAGALAQHKGRLCLRGLNTLSAPLAKKLAEEEKGDLKRFKALSAKAAEALSRAKCNTLRLDGLRELSPEVAKALAQNKGNLYLCGLTTLSPEVAEALAQHEGTGICLGWELAGRGLTTLSDEAAKALAQYQGTLELGRLTTLSDEAAKALRANPKIQLPVKFR